MLTTRFVPRRLQLPSGELCNAEPKIEGNYEKHNDNNGTVYSGVLSPSLTPQAFSHFSLEKTGGLLLVCDIQGVGDFYTDPQIHSSDGKGFGLGNLGARGIARFKSTHRCNCVCRQLGLQPF